MQGLEEADDVQGPVEAVDLAGLDLAHRPVAERGPDPGPDDALVLVRRLGGEVG